MPCNAKVFQRQLFSFTVGMKEKGGILDIGRKDMLESWLLTVDKSKRFDRGNRMSRYSPRYCMCLVHESEYLQPSNHYLSMGE